jgi:lysophospholipase L1-like esterase
MIARVTIPGDAVRIRLDNTFGTEPLVIGRATVGLRVQGALVAAGSTVPLTFNGEAGVTIPSGGSRWSDRAALPVTAQQDLAVSFHVPGAQVRPSQHTNAVVTSYRSADGSGDVVSDESRAPFTQATTSFWWLKAIDVETAPAARAIVAFGDSITDGTCTTRDAHDRWEDLLSVRLALAQDAAGAARPPLRSVLNEGIGGNTVTRAGLTPPPDSPPGLERFERDVLSHHGVSDVIVFMGTNDIRRGASTGSLIAGLAEISKRIDAAGLRSIGVTIIPRHNVAPTDNNSGWNDAKSEIRREVNQWIRSRGSFDAFIDFDAVVRDPARPMLMQPRFNCGDGIHPSPAGYYAMGRAVDLGLFRPRPRP